MELVVMSVYDSKAGGFLAPFFVRNVPVGVRWFETCVRDTAHDFHKFPNDFALFSLGNWSDEDASFQLLSTPKAVVTAFSILANEKEVA